MNNAEYRCFNNYAQELSKLQIENIMLKKKLERIKETIDCDDFHKFEKYCETLCSEAHHCYTKQVLEIIGEKIWQ